MYRYFFWYFQNDLTNGAKFGVLPPDLSFQCLLGFSSEDQGFVGFNCVVVI